MQTTTLNLATVKKEERKALPLLKVPDTLACKKEEKKKLPKVYSEALFNRLSDIREKLGPVSSLSPL